MRGGDAYAYYGKKVYVDKAGPRRLPVWLLPAAVTVLLAVLVFFVLPAAVGGLQALFGKASDANAHPVERILDGATKVVEVTAADVLDRPDLRAARVTQALYNTPVEVDASRSAYGFSAVRLPDGTEGFVDSAALTDARDSAEPYLYRYKLVVSDRVRRIMSHASQGTLLQEVMMGTVLYADYRGDGIYRVALAGGGTGWIGSNGLIELPVDGAVQRSDAESFVSSAMGFLSMTYLPGGLTQFGIDAAGLVQVSAAVNGVVLPHALADLARAGAEVPVVRDEATGEASTDGWASGDLVLLGPADAADGAATAADVALYVGEGQVLMARPSRSSIRLLTLSDEPALLVRVLGVRRLFGAASAGS